MKKSQELKTAAAETYAAAAEYGNQALRESIGQAQKLLQEAVDRSGPAIREAKLRSATYASQRLDDFEPHIRGTLAKVTPAVEAAREKITDEILPKLQDMLHEAAELPAIAEVSSRNEAAVQALSSELASQKKSKAKQVFKFLAAGAAAAGAVAAVRHFLTPKDDGWTAHEPSKAYVNNSDTFANAARFVAETSAPETAEETVEVEPEAGAQDSPAEETSASQYGEGSYVGDNPPEGFVIKGNERSMKYHVEGTGGYKNTIPEVWFNSEEAAQAAGFTKAQR